MMEDFVASKMVCKYFFLKQIFLPYKINFTKMLDNWQIKEEGFRDGGDKRVRVCVTWALA